MHMYYTVYNIILYTIKIKNNSKIIATDKKVCCMKGFDKYNPNGIIHIIH